jgi:hypothetical protein
MSGRSVLAAFVALLGCTAVRRPAMTQGNEADPTAAAALEAAVPADAAPAPTGADTPAALFEARAKPVLESSCMPCHFPGGKMYDRLPFDKPETVASHSEGILRRIKDPEKRAALEAFLGANR